MTREFNPIASRIEKTPDFLELKRSKRLHTVFIANQLMKGMNMHNIIENRGLYLGKANTIRDNISMYYKKGVNTRIFLGNNSLIDFKGSVSGELYLFPLHMVTFIDRLMYNSTVTYREEIYVWATQQKHKDQKTNYYPSLKAWCYFIKPNELENMKARDELITEMVHGLKDNKRILKARKR